MCSERCTLVYTKSGFSLRALDFKVVTEEMYLFCFLSATKLLILHLFQTNAADLHRIQQTAQLHGKYGPNELLAGGLAA